MSTPGSGLARSLLVFRVLAYVVGVLLLLLTLGVVLRYGFGIPELSRTVSPVHGFMFVVYLVAMVDLARRVGWGVQRIVLLTAAGIVPGLSFVAERRVVRELAARPV